MESYYKQLQMATKKLGIPGEIQQVSRKFEVFKDTLRWIYIKGLEVGSSKFNELAFYLDSNIIPFVGIAQGDGVYFVDFSFKYIDAIRRKIYTHSPYDRTNFEDFVFVYNYYVFGVSEIKLKDSAPLFMDRAREVVEKRGLDYIITLTALDFFDDIGYIAFEILPRNLTFKGLYLMHQVYDEESYLTLKFAYNILNFLAKIAKATGYKLRILQESGIKTKKKLIDMVEEKLKNYLLDTYGINYPADPEELDIERRIRRMEKFLGKVLL